MLNSIMAGGAAHGSGGCEEEDAMFAKRPL
jgi:hypothetical protein